MLLTQEANNLLLNSNFLFWQRGSVFNANHSDGTYFADRWCQEGTGSGNRNITRETHTVGQTDVPGNPIYFLRWDQDSAASSQMAMCQRIENVRSAQGEKLTIALWLKADSASTGDYRLQIRQNFGSGGSSDVLTAEQDLVLTTSWTRQEITIDVPSISGKSIGSNDHFLEVRILMPATGTYTLDIGAVQAVVGGSIGDFYTAGRNFAEELAMCQRFYEKSYDIETDPGTATTAGSVRIIGGGGSNDIQGYTFKITKRDTPSVTLYNTDSGATGSWHGHNTASNYTVSPSSVGENNAGVLITSPGADDNISGHWTADAEL